MRLRDEQRAGRRSGRAADLTRGRLNGRRPGRPFLDRGGPARRSDLFSGGDADTFAIRRGRGAAYDLGLTRGDAGTTVAVLDDRGRVLVESGDPDAPASSSPGGRAVPAAGDLVP